MSRLYVLANLIKKTLKRINKLVMDAKRSPLDGIENLNQFKENLSFVSRRIDDTNRVVLCSYERVNSCNFVATLIMIYEKKNLNRVASELNPAPQHPSACSSAQGVTLRMVKVN
jgi:Txe/YoeB family toxin of Txe-Axe toxin-antitoxin module